MHGIRQAIDETKTYSDASTLTFASFADTTQLTATVTDANGKTVSGATVTWATSDATVATVSSTGLVTSVAIGTATITATSGSANTTATAVVTCSTDTDSDRLYDCVETNTGTYVNTSDTGTDPNDSDSDDDSIDDGDEVLGTSGGLDLPGLGADPNKPTILVEYNWFDDDIGGSSHSHRPTAQMMDSLSAVFGREGIQLINDYGQGSAPFDGGNLISDADGDVLDQISGMGAEFYAYKAANFASNRNGYFHYAMHPHSYNGGTVSGMAVRPGNDFLIASRYHHDDYQWVAGTIMHELGHNLGLQHGGNEKQRYKPNYNSVMNYQYQKSGVDNNCTIPGNGVLAYSHGTRPSLDENALVEKDGICGSKVQGTDWNDDGDFDDVLAMNIDGRWKERSGSTLCQDAGKECVLNVEKIYNSDLTVLTDHNDWDALVFSGILTSADLSMISEVIVEDDAEDVIREPSDPIDPLAPTQIPTRRPGNK